MRKFIKFLVVLISTCSLVLNVYAYTTPYTSSKDFLDDYYISRYGVHEALQSYMTGLWKPTNPLSYGYLNVTSKGIQYVYNNSYDNLWKFVKSNQIAYNAYSYIISDFIHGTETINLYLISSNYLLKETDIGVELYTRVSGPENMCYLEPDYKGTNSTSISSLLEGSWIPDLYDGECMYICPEGMIYFSQYGECIDTYLSLSELQFYSVGSTYKYMTELGEELLVTYQLINDNTMTLESNGVVTLFHKLNN